jgi:mono/diheme cytochrome c family protein
MLMPPVGGSLTSEQFAAVLTYIRRSWGNEATPVDRALVDEVRGVTSSRSRPWTEEELLRVRR